MIECHDLPTADVYTAKHYSFVNNVKQAAVNLPLVVLIERSGQLENGLAGFKRFVQISSSYLPTIPKHGEQVEINGKTYKYNNPMRRQNPGFVTFWESEIQISK